MLLRLIDKSDAQLNNRYTIEIILQTDSEDITFTVSYVPSPQTGNFRKSLEWYFQEYIQSQNQQSDDRGVAEDIVKFGQEMGNRLQGENKELNTVKDAIESIGYEHLSVLIESSRIAFFQEHWEMVMLPGTKRPLSVVSKDFVRRFTGRNELVYDAELGYDLAVAPPVNEEMGLPPEMANSPLSEGRKETPLTIIHAISQSSSASPSNGFNASVQSLRWGESVNYELWPCNDWTALQRRIADKDRPVHIFHYEGPIMLVDGIPYVYLTDNDSDIEQIALYTLAELLSRQKSALLAIDACVYREQEMEVSADLGFAGIAEQAGAAGLKNVLGLNHLADPWTRAQCFQTVYDHVASGGTLGDAISEARKFLQSQSDHQTFKTKGIPFQRSSLLCRYGGQTAHFFTTPQVQTDIAASPYYNSICKCLLGFRGELLPPQEKNCEDHVLLPVLSSYDSGSILLLTGQTGSGKTHAIHQASFYLILHRKVEYAFYFDCSANFYSKDDILQMIAPVLDCSPDQKKVVEDKLATIRCCFVFDNLSQKGLNQLPHANDKEISKLNQFFTKLVAKGHIVMITGTPGTAADCFPGLAYREISIPPLSDLAQRVLATDTLRRYHVEDNKEDIHYFSLLRLLQGHPFLIKKVMPGLAVENANELVSQIADRFNSTSDAVGVYYTWQWSKLPPIWKKLLLLLIDSQGLLLEMIMLVCDKWEGGDEGKNGNSPAPAKTGSDGGKRVFEPASALFSELGDYEARFSDAIDCWDRAGFIISHAHGKVIDARCISFLKEHQVNDKLDHEDRLKVLTSQIICEGIRLLSHNLQQQPNSIILHSILMNRRLWAIHLETLWFAAEYLGFIRSKTALDALLHQAKLGDDSAAWSLDLLKRSKLISGPTPQLEASISWLTLALSGLAKTQAEQEPIFDEAQSYWQRWLDQFDSEKAQENAPLFHHAALFLRILYQKKGQWQVCRNVSETAYKFYLPHEDWPRVIQSLKSLVLCCFQLNDIEQAEAYEDRLLTSVPFDKFPEDFKAQLTMEVVTAKVARDDIEQAQSLLDNLTSSTPSERLKPMLDRIQSEIDKKKKARNS